jgi:hypothetical protein
MPALVSSMPMPSYGIYPQIIKINESYLTQMGSERIQVTRISNDKTYNE